MFLPPAASNSLIYSTVKSRIPGKLGNAPFSETLPLFRLNAKVSGICFMVGGETLKSSKYTFGAPVDPAGWPFRMPRGAVGVKGVQSPVARETHRSEHPDGTQRR